MTSGRQCLEADVTPRRVSHRPEILLPERFREVAARYPQNPAIDVPPGAERPVRALTTYAELNDWSDELALALLPLVGRESVVAILLPRDSAKLYVAQLAILKAGAAYTCCDLSFPNERINLILADAQPVVLLTDVAGQQRSLGFQIDPDRVWTTDRKTHANNGSSRKPELEKPGPMPRITSSSLAYIIYTSGTTGQPKGVMIEHGSIDNLVDGDCEEFQLRPNDRIAQGSSAAYDSSAEEVWLAFAVGATVVVMDEETARCGPDLIPWLHRERISVFCPPPTLLRTTGCLDPAAALPDLRLLYVGGEPLPQDVAARWARGRQLVNGYGPTECTVTCLRGPITVGGPISIGHPVPGAQAWILDEWLRPVAGEAEGELCIGGKGLARGYLRQPTSTAAKFVAHPTLGRIYRTGDLARRAADGSFLHLGRMDSQVKIRGYRVELEEIESCLSECTGVRSAACCLQGHPENPVLTGFIVPHNTLAPPSSDALRDALRTKLPDYMIPSRIGRLDQLPRTLGGKLHRAGLPKLNGQEPGGANDQAEPRNALERRLASGFREVLRLERNVSIHEDFFHELNGDSLSAAELVTWARLDPLTAWIAARDLYDSRTIAALAERAPVNEPLATPARLPLGKPLNPSAGFIAVQTLVILKELVFGSTVAYLGAFYVVPALADTLGWFWFCLLAPWLGLTGLLTQGVVMLAWAVWLKRRLIGRYEPTRAPVWGEFYLRNWIVQRAVRKVPWWLIVGSEFQCLALRALGARIGKRVHLHRGVDLLRGGWDLLEIGDNVTVSASVGLGLVEYQQRDLVIQPITLQSGSTLETQAFISGRATVGENGWLAARSWLPPGESIPPGQRWDGIPAKPAGLAPALPRLATTTRCRSPLLISTGSVLAQVVLLALLAVPTALLASGIIPALVGSADDRPAWLTTPQRALGLLIANALLLALAVPATLALEAIACRALGRVPTGVSSRWSFGYIRIWLKTALLEFGSHWLYGTLFWPYWLRLAGMKVGPGCEISSLYETIPENVEIGEKTFCADGIYLGVPRLHQGTVTVSSLRIGRNCFFGNGAILPAGLSVPDEVLLGVGTVAPSASLRPGSSWFGHPPIELPRRQIIQLDPQLTHLPSPFRYLVRIFWELLRFSLPVVLALIIPLWYAVLARARDQFAWPVVIFVFAPLLTAAAVAISTLTIVALKWGLLGRVKPSLHPLWTSWASRWDFVCLAWSLYMKPLVSWLDGTPALAWLLRCMGVRIGHGVVLGTGFADDLPDPDMLIFGDGATVDCLFQAHTFEDRVLKLDYISIEPGATLGRHAVLLYGSAVGAGTEVAPNSIVMKHEHLQSGLQYEGAPTRARRELAT